MATPQDPLLGGAAGGLGPDEDDSVRNAREIEWRIVLSHAANMFGTKAWEFALPLLTIRLSGGRLVAPAVVGMATTAAGCFLGPGIGRLTDRVRSRLSVVCGGVAVQAVAILASLAVLAVALALGLGGEVSVRGPSGPPADAAWFGGDRPWLGCSILMALCVSVMAEVLGGLAARVSVERDWVPTAFEPLGEQALARVNGRLANVDLVCEILGPLASGAIFAATSTGGGFILIALLNLLSFGPQVLLLEAARSRSPALSAPRDAGGAGGSGGEAEAAGAWKSFFTHPSGIPLLTCSYAILFFTVLSSHDVVITAFLASQGLNPVALSGFRAAGALSGILGSSSFEHLARRAGSARLAAGAFILWQAASCFVAAAAGTVMGYSPGALLPFLAAIVLSRPGLYGFDVGFSTLSQGLVDERSRNAVGAATEGLCTFAELLCNLTTAVVTTKLGKGSFGLLVWASAGCVGTSALLFGLWCALFHEHEHYHGGAGEEQLGEAHEHGSAGHGHDHGHTHSHDSRGAVVPHVHEHSHTLQQDRTLVQEANGVLKHRHVHYHGPRLMLSGRK